MTIQFQLIEYVTETNQEVERTVLLRAGANSSGLGKISKRHKGDVAYLRKVLGPGSVNPRSNHRPNFRYELLVVNLENGKEYVNDLEFGIDDDLAWGAEFYRSKVA